MTRDFVEQVVAQGLISNILLMSEKLGIQNDFKSLWGKSNESLRIEQDALITRYNKLFLTT